MRGADRGERRPARRAAGRGRRGAAGANSRPHEDEQRRWRAILSTISALWTLLPARTPKQLIAVSSSERRAGDRAVGQRQAGQLEEIAREGDRDRGHPARLDDEQQRPAVEEGRHRPPGVAQIGILAADLGPARGKLGIDEGAGDRDRGRRSARRRR